MKTEREISDAISNVDDIGSSQYPGMTYEQGVTEALRWVLGEVPDEEFEYAKT